MPAAPRGVTRSRDAPVGFISTLSFTLAQLHTVRTSPSPQAARVCAASTHTPENVSLVQNSQILRVRGV